MERFKKIMSKKLEELEENLLEEQKISSYITELTLKYGSFDDITKPVLEEKEKAKCLYEKYKNNLENDTEYLDEYYDVDVFERNTYSESSYNTETKELFKTILDETLTGKDSKLDNYYQREINKYYIQFLNVVLNYKDGYCTSNPDIEIGILGNDGISFKIENQIIHLVENKNIRRLGRYSESDKILYLFLLKPSKYIRKNLTEEEKEICKSRIVKSVFFHEMTHKLDSEALRGNDPDARLSITKKERRNLENNFILPNKTLSQKRNSDGEFNATLSMFIQYFQDILNDDTSDTSKEDKQKYIRDMIVKTLKRFREHAQEVYNEHSILSVLADLYNGLNETNKNRLANSLNDYFSQKFFESTVHYETLEESYTRLKKLLAEQ